jgi:hypothetical protein
VQELMMALIRIQKCMDLILCGKMTQEGEGIDQDAVAVTFRHIISEAPVPEDKKQTVSHYLDILREDPEVRRVFGHAARVKTIMMAQTGNMTQSFHYRMHVKALGLPVEDERQDVISPTEFFSLVDQFEKYAKQFRKAIASDAATLARISKNYEDTSQLRAAGTSPARSEGKDPFPYKLVFRGPEIPYRPKAPIGMDPHSGCLLLVIGMISVPFALAGLLRFIR